ncbi:MAG TPA: pilin [Candidatus Saccharimonadales bacterium]|nr:pilin [Candidatus Saccharimonadales bacterium]
MKKKLSALLLGLTTVCLLMISGAMPVYAQGAQQEINNGLCAGSNFQFSDNPGACSVSGTDATTQIDNIIHTIVNLLSAIVGIVAVIMIIVGGFRYITSGGNDTSVTSAKNTILYAIIGLVVVALAQIIVRFTLSKLTNT